MLAYLVMFRLEELGMGHFKRLVNTQHTGKMHKVGRGCGPPGNTRWQDAQGREGVGSTGEHTLVRCTR